MIPRDLQINALVNHMMWPSLCKPHDANQIIWTRLWQRFKPMNSWTQSKDLTTSSQRPPPTLWGWVDPRAIRIGTYDPRPACSPLLPAMKVFYNETLSPRNGDRIHILKIMDYCLLKPTHITSQDRKGVIFLLCLSDAHLWHCFYHGVRQLICLFPCGDGFHHAA